KYRECLRGGRSPAAVDPWQCPIKWHKRAGATRRETPLAQGRLQARKTCWPGRSYDQSTLTAGIEESRNPTAMHGRKGTAGEKKAVGGLRWRGGCPMLSGFESVGPVGTALAAVTGAPECFQLPH